MILLYGAGGEPGRGEIPMDPIRNRASDVFPSVWGVEDKYSAETKENQEGGDAMPGLSNRKRAEWSFFIDPADGRRKYNELCRRCRHPCKQSWRAVVLECGRYESKRSTAEMSFSEAAGTGNVKDMK